MCIFCVLCDSVVFSVKLHGLVESVTVSDEFTNDSFLQPAVPTLAVNYCTSITPSLHITAAVSLW